MDDGLAEKLFNAFWDPLVAAGWPRPCAWADLHPTQREAWLRVAIAARQDAAAKQSEEITMLREANAAWKRQSEETPVDALLRLNAALKRFP